MTISPLSHLLLKRTTTPFLARRILTSSTASLPARRLLLPSSSSITSSSTRSYAVIEPITRPRPAHPAPTPTPAPAVPPPSPSSSSSSSSPPPNPLLNASASDDAPKRKRSAFEKYLARGLPEWMIAFIILYWTWRYFYEDFAYLIAGPKNHRSEDADKMERATAARDAYFAQLEEEMRLERERGGKQVSFLPGAQQQQQQQEGEKEEGGKKEEKAGEEEGKGKSWYRRLI